MPLEVDCKNAHIIIDSQAGFEAQALTRWQDRLKCLFREPRELLQYLQLPESLADPLPADFPLRVTREFASRMRKGDHRDPLLRQVLPIADERLEVSGYGIDPLGERQALAGQGLLHKYRSRILLVMTGACAIHCRYCFRRHFPYAEQKHLPQHWDSLLAHLASSPAVNEVILSGGDPLMLSNESIRQIIRDLRQTQVKTLRIHTRLPVVLPQRVDQGLLDALHSFDGRCVVVVHANHPREIDAETGNALRHLGTRATVLNQSVLLKEINDSAEVLSGLSETLFGYGVLPYYLFQLDAVAGAAHFQVTDEVARSLMQQLSALLPGYLVPRLAREIAGEPSKTLISF